MAIGKNILLHALDRGSNRWPVRSKEKPWFRSIQKQLLHRISKQCTFMITCCFTIVNCFIQPFHLITDLFLPLYLILDKCEWTIQSWYPTPLICFWFVSYSPVMTSMGNNQWATTIRPNFVKAGCIPYLFKGIALWLHRWYWDIMAEKMKPKNTHWWIVTILDPYVMILLRTIEDQTMWFCC